METKNKENEKSWRWQSDSWMRKQYGRGPGDLLCYMASKFKYWKASGKLYAGESFYIGQREIAGDLGCSVDTLQRDAKKVEGILLAAPAKGEFNYYGINVEAWPKECRYLLEKTNTDLIPTQVGDSPQNAAHRINNVVKQNNQTTNSVVNSKKYSGELALCLDILTPLFKDSLKESGHLHHWAEEEESLRRAAKRVLDGYYRNNYGLGLENYVRWYFDAVNGERIKRGQDFTKASFLGSSDAFKYIQSYYERGLKGDEEILGQVCMKKSEEKGTSYHPPVKRKK